MKKIKIISWNLLADCQIQNNLNLNPLNKQQFDKNQRIQNILKYVKDKNADIQCFQEFEQINSEKFDLIMGNIGYESVQCRSNTTSKKQKTCNATFFKKQLKLSREIHKSRLLTTIFSFDQLINNQNQNNIQIPPYNLAICNMHLEGNPQDPVTRLNQVKSTLDSLHTDYKPDGIVMCGDFNCEYDSAVSMQLYFGHLHKNVQEYNVEIKDSNKFTHPFKLINAQDEESIQFKYQNDVLRSKISFCGTQFDGLLIDQMWFSDNIKVINRLDLLDNYFLENNNENINTGYKDIYDQLMINALPNKYYQSDHLPIGTDIEIDFSKKIDQTEMDKSKTKKKNYNQSSLNEQIENNIFLDEQINTLKEIQSVLPQIKGKPSDEDKEQIEAYRLMLDDFTSTLNIIQKNEVKNIMKIIKKEKDKKHD